MTETVSIPKETLANLEERAKRLAQEKSHLQLIIHMMERLGTVTGLENTVEEMLRILLDTVGGTNISMHYSIDNDLFTADVFGKRMKIDTIADPTVAKVFESKTFIVLEGEFRDTKMTTPAFTKAWTWVFPLIVGTELVGVISMENLAMGITELRNHLPIFFNYAGLILKNEISGHTRLKKAYDRLEEEVVVRKKAETELLKSKEELEKRVIQRTSELADSNTQLQLELSERKKAEERLQDTMKLQLALLNTAMVGIAYLKNRTFQWVNDRFTDIFGYGVGELDGQSIRMIYATSDDYDRIGNVAYPIMAKGKIYTDEFPMKRKDGSLIWCLFNVKALDHSDLSAGAILVIMDDSERMSALDRLMDKQRELEELNQTLKERVQEELSLNREKDFLLIQQTKQAALGEMIANIAHQWRQPLNAMGILIQDIQEAYLFNELDEEYLQKSVTKAMDVLLHMSNTIDDFRNFIRPDREKVRFNLREVVGKILDLVSASLKDHDIECQLDLSDDFFIFGYPNEFGQALLNILNNADDALREGKTEHPLIKVRLVSQGNGEASIIVSNNGPHIPEGIIEKIFEPYFSSKEERQGTGLGLYMTRKIIESNMGGKIVARNLPDQGVEFEITVQYNQTSA